MDAKLWEREPPLFSKPAFVFEDFAKVEKRFLDEFERLLTLCKQDIADKSEELCVGVDWMHGQWLAAAIIGNHVSLQVFSDIQSLCKAFEKAKMILVDAPIGLPENVEEAHMRPDRAMRSYLKVKDRKSSVFNTPFRQMVYEDNINRAWDIRVSLGAKISKQGLAILPMIRQVDSFLQEFSEWKPRLLESHPECAFQRLNADAGVQNSKHTDDGVMERSRILKCHGVDVVSFFEEYPLFDKIDVLDAICLAITARNGLKYGFETLPFNPREDSHGIPMRITLSKR